MSEKMEHEKYNHEQLAAMGKVYYSGSATPWQKEKYEFIRASLLAELQGLEPNAPDSGTAAYLRAAITASLNARQAEEKIILDGMRANMQTATNQLKNWK